MTPSAHRRRRSSKHPRCELCGLEYTADSCDPDARPTVSTWGQEPWWHDPTFWDTDEDRARYELEPGECPEPLDRCPDCHVELDRAHHSNCCQAHCWSCDAQALGCPHSFAALGIEP